MKSRATVAREIKTIFGRVLDAREAAILAGAIAREVEHAEAVEVLERAGFTPAFAPELLCACCHGNASVWTHPLVRGWALTETCTGLWPPREYRTIPPTQE